MFGFGKKKKKQDDLDETAPIMDEEIEVEGATDDMDSVTSSADFSRAEGPWDVDEVDTNKDYLDFGSMRIRMQDGLNMRLDLENKTQQMIAVTITSGKSSLQVQAFAAPKSTGIWDDIRREISDSVRKQGGSVDVRNGSLGREMYSRLPAKTADGRKGYRVARFVGVDGPRWFLRGVFSGEAAMKSEAAAEMEKIFRGIVVVRGEDPLPPRDLLPMKVPASIRQAQEQEAAREASASQQENTGAVETGEPAEKSAGQAGADTGVASQKLAGRKLEMPRRGPEIAEIR